MSHSSYILCVLYWYTYMSRTEGQKEGIYSKKAKVMAQIKLFSYNPNTTSCFRRIPAWSDVTAWMPSQGVTQS